jgi:type I restriction enzyme M protein
MLDNETKRKIDSARSILVGKVPDPKAQVEQITTALIYKFMDDMDRASEELGGVATFVTGELEQFKWAKLMSKELGGEARLILYSQALTAFSKADGIPEIFRTIFKDAFLPYRDPETLNLFLKEIDYFDYDHSENLGDAFEYLLSVLGSQGDAGQFRTPRHIIDFIVEVLEPKKSDSILDPSCGTAGFLISAYKHISANENLSPVDKKQLMHNFTGYDISPDMVRLSLVNMYLHSFPQPKIYEYDTLTSEDRWNDSFDVILANPPFMTPKGGIRPHSRFSVQANRSEVLFVDYIAEHLNLNGRAGIIVPEGIIFQSANAYKALRKMLVETGFLWAVVSLPAGVFQPYSGVKTSILLLDRAIAKKNDSVLFVKISNDGYDLGAQRREITHNDLIPALEVIKNHRKGETVESPIAQLVLKTKIAESGDYNLTGERYKETKAHENLVYPMVKLGNVCKILKGSPITKNDAITSGNVPVIAGGQQPAYFHNAANRNAEVITVSASGAYAGFVNFFRLPIFASDCSTIESENQKILKTYFVYLLLKNKQDDIYKFQRGMGQPHVYPKDLVDFEIPLPPLEIQNAIIAEIEQWQKVIDGAKQVVANYRPTISIQPDWEMVKLGDVCTKITDGTHHTPQYQDEGVPFLRVTDLTESNMTKKFISKDEHTQLLKRCNPEKGDVLFSKNGTIGVTKLIDWDWEFSIFVSLCLLKPNNSKVASKYLEIVLSSQIVYEQLIARKKSGTITNLHLIEIKQVEIPLPPIEIQDIIVEKIEKERAAVESCKTLIAMFEDKIKRKIEEVWGE